MEDSGLSPIRRQYLDLKRRHPDAILFFRLGDFYETFESDAEIAARVLDLALTSREMGRGERLPMAGLPAHAAEGYLARLIAEGYHVALAEQVGDVVKGGLVRREVVRVLTPGTVIEDSLLAADRNNFLAALALPEGGEQPGRCAGLAYLDVSTGDFWAGELPYTRDTLAAELTRIGPAECLVPEGRRAFAVSVLPDGAHVTERGADRFAPSTASRALARHFGGGAEGSGLHEAPLALAAAGSLVAYVAETRESAVRTLSPPRLYSTAGTMLLDRATRRNLDLLDGGGTGLSLVRVLDRTRTSMGARLLRAWLGQPLLDPDSINRRLDAVETLARHASARGRVIVALKGLADLERLGARAGQEALAPRECLALAGALARVPAIDTALRDLPLAAALADARAALDPVDEATGDVRAHVREGATIFGEGVVLPGVSAELDELRSLAGDGRQWIAGLEQRERERSGVRGLKVGFNKVFGYYLEVSAAQCAQPTDYYQRQVTGADAVLPHLEKLGWTRKQTVANAERFVTPELKEMEGRVNRAADEALRLERTLYNGLLARLATLAPRISATARAIARIDVVASLAEVAEANRYVRPVVDGSTRLEIAGGRHPVVEQALPPGAFVPNDTRMNGETRTALLTGPNMAGKSTYLRQVALIVAMAQSGSFVPAVSAAVGVVDRIFTRIGAQDDLAAGRSTFMVEMSEAAAILRSATGRSLVILDEVGRGTSTHDGLSLARAILEDLHGLERPGGSPKTLFATHYHELTSLAEHLPGVENYRLEVLEQGDDVVFLHSVVPGGADRSYGVHVAKLAGVPERVVARAASLLRELEATPPVARREQPPRAVMTAPCSVCDELAALEVLQLSPLQAQAELHRLWEQARRTLRDLTERASRGG
ncbi:MAG: DNA mismatch repair protein MutS [Chloroflexi bacterium]|nr:DNA mismatch repair protein MutS [Chloroflexota bacterium]